MDKSELIEKLKKMRLPVIAEQYELQSANPEYSQLSFDENGVLPTNRPTFWQMESPLSLAAQGVAGFYLSNFLSTGGVYPLDCCGCLF